VEIGFFDLFTNDWKESSEKMLIRFSSVKT